MDRFVPLLVGDAMADPTVVAALDGPMFGNCDPGSTYTTSDCSDPRFLLLDHGGVAIQTPANHADRGKGITLSVLQSGATQWSSGDTPALHARVAVQTYPTLVSNGLAMPVASDGGNGVVNWRAAVVELRDGRLAFVVGRDTMPGFAGKLGPLGLRTRWAGYTDGGGSTALGWRNPDGTVLVTGPRTRPVAVFLVARPPAPSLSSDAVAGFLAPAIVLAGVTALGVLAYWKRDELRDAWDDTRGRLEQWRST